MRKLKQKDGEVSFRKFLSVCTLISCLLFLTSVNYFLYPSEDANNPSATASQSDNTASDNDVSGPTEEKSSSSGLSLAEEMVHETHPTVNFNVTNFYYLHHIAEAEKLEIFHPEIILPPPKPLA